VYVSVYARAHTHCTDWVLGFEPRSQDETPEGPEESRWTKFRHTYVRICVQSTHDDDCFYYYSWRNNVVIAFGTLSSFLT